MGLVAYGGICMYSMIDTNIEMGIHMQLGRKIKELRKEKNLCQEQLAEAMGVSAASVSKWETGQCIPELTLLMDLADYFGVSVDFLIGHKITGNYQHNLLLRLDDLINEEKMDEAAQTAEKLLLCYPNHKKIIQKVSEFYYVAYAKTRSKSMMEKSIALTKRLLALESDSAGARYFELLSHLGNQYALMEDYQQARIFYTQGNVGNMNGYALAQLLAREGKFEEAVEALSDIFQKNTYNIIMCLLQLAECWTQLKCQEKAAAALQYGVGCLNLMHENSGAELTALKANLYVALACNAEKGGQPDQADAFIKKAIHSVCNSDAPNGYDFCVCNGSKELLGDIFANPQDIMDYLRLSKEERLYLVAEGERN